MMALPFILTSAALLMSSGVFAEECSSERMRRCRNEALRDITALNACGSLRESFDCLLWQTSMCLSQGDQDSNGDALTRVWRHLQSFCESDGNWYTRSCFQRSELKTCERWLPANGQSTDHTACRSYIDFRECVTLAASECSADDRRLLGSYLMDKGRRRAWNCPRDSQGGALPGSFAAQSVFGDCGSGWQESVRECGRRFEEDEKEARIRNDSDMRHHRTCCALVHYEECIESGVSESDRDRCRTRDITEEMRNRFPYFDCADHTRSECSSGLRVLVTPLLMLVLVMAALRPKSQL